MTLEPTDAVTAHAVPMVPALQDAKQLKALMYALSSQTDLPAGHTGSVSLPQPRRVGELSEQEVAFVFTDIESSTELSQQDGDAFKQVGAACCA